MKLSPLNLYTKALVSIVAIQTSVQTSSILDITTAIYTAFAALLTAIHAISVVFTSC